MDFEKYTERSRGFVQAAQGLALRSNHQQFTPEHLLKVLLDDREGLAANLIAAAGGASAKALAGAEVQENPGARAVRHQNPRPYRLHRSRLALATT